MPTIRSKKLSPLNHWVYITCLLIFLGNQFLEFNDIYHPWMRAYADDLVAIPIVMGGSLFLMRQFYHRDFQLTNFNVLATFLMFSFTFEWLLPRVSPETYTSDPWDLVAYALGSLVVWRWLKN